MPVLNAAAADTATMLGEALMHTPRHDPASAILMTAQQFIEFILHNLKSPIRLCKSPGISSAF
jgi:hypothetical protein